MKHGGKVAYCVKSFSNVLCHCGVLFTTQEVIPYMISYMLPTASIAHLAGVWTVVVVTTHRYIAVYYPHRVKKFASLRVARYQASSALRLLLHRLTFVELTNSRRCLVTFNEKFLIDVIIIIV